MFDKSMCLSDLLINHLNQILREGFSETGTSCFIFDASGELLSSFSDKAEVMEEITEIARQAALDALNGNASRIQFDRRWMTEIIQHHRQIQGVLVGWIESPQQISLWQRLMQLTRVRIEDSLTTEEEINELSSEILNEHRELELVHILSTRLAGLTEMNLVYHEILKHVVEIVKANCGYIFKLNKAADELRIVQQYPHLTGHNASFPVRFSDELLANIVQTGESILIEDTTHPLWNAESGYPFTPPLMGCALQIGENSLGVILVSREAGAPVFTAGDLKILDASVVQSAVAMMNVSHLENLKRSNQELHQEVAERMQAEEKFRKLFEQSNDAIFIRALDGKIMHVNSRACEMLGYDEDQLQSMTTLSLFAQADYPSAKKAIQTVNDTGSIRFEARYQKRDGEIIDVEISSRIIDPKKGIVQGIVRDITRRKQMEKELRYNARHDALTKLPNRALFFDRLEQSIKNAKRRKGYAFAVLFLDLDRFKVINDSLGHTVGDQLLVEISQRLKDCMRLEDMVARLGGDEFAILLDDIKGLDDAMHVVNRIHKKLARRFNLSGHEVFTNASVGIVLSQTGYDEPESVLRDADMAMYRAKVHGNPYEVFDTEMYINAVERLRMETGLRWALDRKEFRLHYQPIISLETGRIQGFEALIRWQHPDGDLVPPDKFIPVAEETGLIVPIGQWVISEACRQIGIWHAKFPERSDLTINVNLSSKQLMQPDVVEQIGRILKETGIHPRYLKLEITESVIMDSAEFAMTALSQLKAMGLQVQMDDFGTGYSSLSYLHRFPIDVLKIDRSFIMEMNAKNNSKIIQTIVMFAHNMDIGVTAEGIETEEQMVQLQEMDCETGQGYYFSRPVETEAVDALIAADIARQ